MVAKESPLFVNSVTSLNFVQNVEKAIKAIQRLLGETGELLFYVLKQLKLRFRSY